MPGSTSHTPASTFHVGPFDLPNDGGDPYQYSSIMKDAGASVGLFAKLFDNAKWLKDAVDALVSGIASIVAGTTPLVSVPLTPHALYRLYGAWHTSQAATEWVASIANGGMPKQITPSASVFFPVDLPHGASVTSVSITVTPDIADGHAALPATMPTVKLIKIAAAGTETDVWSQVDPSASVLAYDTVHAIVATGTACVVDRSLYTYAVELDGEGSTNYLAGTICSPPTVYFTTTALDLGAA